MEIREQGYELPTDFDAEQSVLAAALRGPDAMQEAASSLKPDHFAHGKLRTIYKAMLSIHSQGGWPDVWTVSQTLKKSDDLDVIGGQSQVEALRSRGDYYPRNAGIYIDRVRDAWMRRKQIEVAESIIGGALSEETARAVQAKAEADLMGISQITQQRGIVTLGEAVAEAMERAEAARNSDSDVTGIPSGFHALDARFGGWQDSDLIILAGRPGMGKTGLSLCLAHNAAKEGYKTFIWSGEMSAQQYGGRLLAREARLNSKKLRTGSITDAEWERAKEKQAALNEMGIFIDDTPALPVEDFCAKCRQMKSSEDIDLIITDYIQLLTAPYVNASRREGEIAHISRMAKGIAKELDIPHIALAQLNRSVETRGGQKKPQLSDLRESGQLEQDADVVSFVYRPEVYGWTTDEDGSSLEGIAEIITRKFRNGEPGTDKLAFVSQYASFENLETHYDEPNAATPTNHMPF